MKYIAQYGVRSEVGFLEFIMKTDIHKNICTYAQNLQPNARGV
jgi:hypothetical protein